MDRTSESAAGTRVECKHYEPTDGKLNCRLCPFHCVIADGACGRCGVRCNEGGRLWARSYGRITAAHLDPTEKKPLYHFHPGSLILSLGSFGCNLTCEFCQNWSISQDAPPSQELLPNDAAQLARDTLREGNIGIAYTYNEPMISFEYLMDTGQLVRDAGMVNVLVTNGIVEAEPLEDLLPLIDAMNVDIKSIRPDFYRRLCGGDGLAARRTVEMAWGRCHVEITNLIIPGENDSDKDLRDLFDWAASVSRRLPLHLSRYHPDYNMDNPPTPSATLRRAYDMARERLDFVYVGNIRMDGTTDTLCPACGTVAVSRSGYTARARTTDGRCSSCGEDLGIVT